MDTLNDQPIFAAELVPHRSLGRRGFRLLLLFSGLACLVYGGFFLATGAWPVGLFFGLDFLLLYAAFRANYRAARRGKGQRLAHQPVDPQILAGWAYGGASLQSLLGALQGQAA